VHPQAFIDPITLKPNPDLAIPWLLRTQMPTIVTGLLGFVLCGLVAAQVSTITADVNSVATLFTSDVYRTLRRREPTQRQLLFVVRLSSLVCGALMLLVAYLFRSIGKGAVNINLIVVGILDMPLFIITVIYGLTWKRINWQGALAGFVCGGIASAACYYFRTLDDAKQIAPIVSSIAALIVTPIVSLLTPAPNLEAREIWRNFFSRRGDEHDPEPFTVKPARLIGKMSALTVLCGFACFLVGVFSAARETSIAAPLAVIGMIAVFAGGVVRVYCE
jgi:Na+/proline symporter